MKAATDRMQSPPGSVRLPNPTGQQQWKNCWKNELQESHIQLPAFTLQSASSKSSSKTCIQTNPLYNLDHYLDYFQHFRCILQPIVILNVIYGCSILIPYRLHLIIMANSNTENNYSDKTVQNRKCIQLFKHMEVFLLYTHGQKTEIHTSPEIFGKNQTFCGHNQAFLAIQAVEGRIIIPKHGTMVIKNK